MRYMFATSPFNQDISNWDVSQVTNMEYMFNNAQAFNQNISSWNVSNVTNMGIMFSYATSFNQPIGNWNVSNVTEMEWMFSGATAFNKDLSLWNVSNVTVFYRMFSDASSFNQNLSSWDISHATNMGFMLSNSGLSVVNYDALLNGWSSQPVQSGVPLGADNLKYCNATTARNYLITSKGWTITGDALDCTALGFENPMEAKKTIIPPDNTPTCYPNPWNTSVNEVLKVEGISDDEIYVTLSDLMGNTIYSKTLQLPNNKEWAIPAEALKGYAKGAYVLKITSRKEFYIFTIIIQ
jgi:surface protein